jgi:prophage DNA circulation protein
MIKTDAVEAQKILDPVLVSLLSWAATTGRAGSALRTMVGDVRAYAMPLLQNDMIELPLMTCFNLAVATGINIYQVETVRRTAAAQPAVSVGAIMTKDTLIQIALATAGVVIANMTFTSRQDVDQIRNAVNVAFAEIEEILADQMDAMSWRAVIKLHAAIIHHLVETARPLPRMLNYRFADSLPSVVLAHRLYADASRADELVKENKIVHPGFCLRQGQALSS